MIIINNVKLAESEAEFKDSLFVKGGTCAGYAKRFKNEIKIFNPQNELVGVLNKYGVLANASLQVINGKSRYWYCFADIDIIGRFPDYMSKADLADNLCIKKEYKPNGELHFIYK
jgi:hypothetical protein